MATALAGGAWAAGQESYQVGVATRAFVPAGAYCWRGARTHALVTTIWYPAQAGAVEKRQVVGPPDAPLFEAGTAAPGAALLDAGAASKRFPLVVLSHGTGGSALMLAWLGTALASHGYIAAAVNHPGNNAAEPYTAAGFLLWWERARDLSVVIDKLLTDPQFGPRIDPERIGAAGFSLGGYTMIEIAGGVTDRKALREFCASPAADGTCQPPPEMRELGGSVDALEETAGRDPESVASLARAGESFRDGRVRAVFAIAPALGPVFHADALKRIRIPVEIVAGVEDDIVPVASSAKHFAASIPGAKLTLLEGGVQHYQFLAVCTAAGRKALPGLCTDKPGVERAALHARTAAMAVAFFDAQLGAPRR